MPLSGRSRLFIWPGLGDLCVLIPDNMLFFFTPCESFTLTSAGGPPPKSERQKVSPGHLDSSEYSSQSQQCYGLDSFYSFSDLQFPQSLFRNSWNRSTADEGKYLYNHHHHHHLVVPPARISLTLSHHSSQFFIASGRSSGLHPVSSQSCCM